MCHIVLIVSHSDKEAVAGAKCVQKNITQKERFKHSLPLQ